MEKNAATVKNVDSASIKSTAPAQSLTLPLELPQLIRVRTGIFIRPQYNLREFLHHELDMARLDLIHDRLWLAGRVGNLRPLHRQLMMRRQIILTEQADMHLLWTDRSIFIKPLPAWLLDLNFLHTNINPNPELRGRAYGFLRTYLLLIQHESDHAIASEHRLLPRAVSWKYWTEFIASLMQDPMYTKTEVTLPRYHYGELRLNRVNWIYQYDIRLGFKHFWRGYYREPQTYQQFVESNFAWLLVAFVFLTTALTAMQLGLATKQMSNNRLFNVVSYVLSVISVVFLLLVLAYSLFVSLILVVYNFLASLSHLKRNLRSDPGMDG